ncbi:MAG: hypothetical protein M1838_003722 [Thelocarpon superellum]|nr:MAG: hypothetical protein M1838_003722 [Thelocarpon superellum]
MAQAPLAAGGVVSDVPAADKGSAVRSIRYDETSSAAQPPVAVTVAVVPPRAAPAGPPHESKTASQRSPSTSSTALGPGSYRAQHDGKSRRDSGLAPTASTAGSSGALADEDATSTTSTPPKAPSPSATSLPRERRRLSRPNLRALASGPKTIKLVQQVDGPAPPPPKVRISMEIPSESLFGMDALDQMSFSHRGSILLSGSRADRRPNLHAGPNTGQALGRATPRDPPAAADRPVLSTEEEMLSQKVRLKYERGDSMDADRVVSFVAEGDAGQGLSPADAAEDGWMVVNAQGSGDAHQQASFTTTARDPRRASVIQREAHEVAGGIEDWQDISGRDVDRYGFIATQPTRPPTSSTTSHPASPPPKTPPPHRPHRVSTILQMASEAPRRRKSLRRANSNSRASRSVTGRIANQNMSTPSLRKPDSLLSHDGSITRGLAHLPFRHSTSRLAGQRHRHWMEEAGNMLTLPPGLADIAEDQNSISGAGSAGVKRKEWERAEKWRKMARVVDRGSAGQGMTFDFDRQDPKLISRTWKGIPDCWRGTAWHAFLSSSARRRKDSLSDEEIVRRFGDYVDQSSPDDVQIDIDVPRTINSHIMFRRRYRGGQRLLFRVLHALSLHFPDTGYVQGMASLAATLLCYYDEEHTFIMLVRMWQLRGLQRLFQPGFGGLMEALGEFERKWLAGEAVAGKMSELGIDPTAYGTRWYLTLFNYSIPFPAQLRVWDVFMLLGDATDPEPSSLPLSPSHPPTASDPTGTISFAGGLDVLHATSAALIAGMRDILLDSDFENAMKVLTSWIPIRDEELLMGVAHAQWRVHHNRMKGVRR